MCVPNLDGGPCPAAEAADADGPPGLKGGILDAGEAIEHVVVLADGEGEILFLDEGVDEVDGGAVVEGPEP